MNSGPICQRIVLKTIVLLGTGGLLFGVGSGCDPTVRTTILGGFQQLATTFVNAAFIAIQVDDNSSTGTTGTTDGSST